MQSLVDLGCYVTQTDFEIYVESICRDLNQPDDEEADEDAGTD